MSVNVFKPHKIIVMTGLKVDTRKRVILPTFELNGIMVRVSTTTKEGHTGFYNRNISFVPRQC